MNRFEQFFTLKTDKPITLETMNSLVLQNIGQAFTEAITKAFDAHLMEAHKLKKPEANQVALQKTLSDVNEFMQKAAQKNPEIFAALMPK